MSARDDADLDGTPLERPWRGNGAGAMTVLVKEDLSLFGIEELEARLNALEHEIGRTQEHLRSKKGSRDEAEALFR